VPFVRPVTTLLVVPAAAVVDGCAVAPTYGVIV
jgi:hypothetical protein